MGTANNLSTNDLETIRQAAADRGDCDLSSLCNQAMWGETDKVRRSALRKVIKAVR